MDMKEMEAWPRCPEAAAWFEQQLKDFAAQNPLVDELRAKFLTKGVALASLVDHWILPEGSVPLDVLTDMGMEPVTHPEGDTVWKHTGARLPGVRFKKRDAPTLALLVEDVEAFGKANGLDFEAVHGDADSQYRCAHLPLAYGELMPISRRGYAGFAPGTIDRDYWLSLKAVRQDFRRRNRNTGTFAAIEELRQTFHTAARLVGNDRAVEEFFFAEREYYLTRNAAARFQYDQQNEIGIGWANHDHHTYRSSRQTFRALMSLWQEMEFETREKFYAGEEAGWGAQVVEHAACRIILFCDVDMAPEELNIDYVSTDLPERQTLGTIGLWCALHGDSIDLAGLHHLECEFDFAREEKEMIAHGHGVMKPFTDLPMLKQAFTQAELWKVDPTRAQELVRRGAITPELAEQFTTVGAAGSHLEILQRWEGFKGFNKTGVSAIIKETDARKQAATTY
jgi:hypothetical protein